MGRKAPHHNYFHYYTYHRNLQGLIYFAFILTCASALISTDSRTVSHVDPPGIPIRQQQIRSHSEDSVEGSGREAITDKSDTVWASGASPDDEDGDVEEVEGSGAAPNEANENVAASPKTKTTTISLITTPSTTPMTVPYSPINDEKRPPHIDAPRTSTIGILPPAITTTVRSIPSSTQTLSTLTTSRTPSPTLPVVTSRPPTIIEKGGAFEELKPGLLAFIVGGLVVLILLVILFVSYIFYRIRKKDEGSYSCDEPHQPAHYSYAYQKASTKEFYA